MTIWYDFTTTLRNRGRSGIANVEWSVGQALLAAAPNMRSFELAGRRGLVEIDPRTRLVDAVYASADNVVGCVVNAAPTWRDHLRHALRSRFGRRADPLIRSLSTIHQLTSELRRRRAQGWRPNSRGERAPRLVDLVAPGDVVVSMGADWDGELAAGLLDLKQRTGCRVVTMVYDLVPLTHTHLAFHKNPDLFTRYYRSLVEVSDLITCISQQSRRDLVEFARAHSLALRRSEVLVLGESPSPTADLSPPERESFFLCVGTIERRKNLELVYDALRILESEDRKLPRVVVAGAPGWGTDDLLVELRQKSTRASRAMVLIGAVDDLTLDRLYRTAGALLFPSHFEGWGLPVREAAIRACPVAAGDSPAIREATAGYAGATILPTDDPGPWADYMRDSAPAVDADAIRPWSAVASDLLGLLPVAR